MSSRDRVLPGEDEDAARVLEDVFERRGVRVMPRSRASAVERTEDGSGVIVTLSDGRKVSGTHCLVAIGSIPNTEDLGLEAAGVEQTPSGHIKVDGVSPHEREQHLRRWRLHGRVPAGFRGCDAGSYRYGAHPG